MNKELDLDEIFGKIEVFALFLDFIIFSFSNVVIWLIFSKFFNFPLKSLQSSALFIACFLIALFTIKTEIVLSFLKYIKNRNRKESTHRIQDAGKGIPFFALFKVFFIVVFRFFFFNILYYLFPVLLIWSCMLGILYSFGIRLIMVSQMLFSVVTSAGIILGFFQYYLSRYEGKVQEKITLGEKTINELIVEEAAFDEFLESINDENLKNRIIKIINPKERLIGFLSDLSEEDKKNRNKISSFLKKIYRGSNAPLISLSDSYLPSFQKYLLCEEKLDASLKNSLKEAYEDFFFSDKLKSKIMNRISKELDMSEYFNFQLANITLVQEVRPKFIFKTGILKSNIDAGETNPGHLFKSASEYMDELKNEIKKIMLLHSFKNEPLDTIEML